MAKRKRSQADEAEPVVEDGPHKTRVVDADNVDDASQRAAKRQAKSERRSKKPANRTHPPKPKDPLSEDTENLIPDQLPPTKGDQFSSNNDFVSLGDAPPATPGIQTEKTKKSKSSKGTSSQPASKNTQPAQQHRFILFIGNLPFSTSNDAITHHFRALQPFIVRHMTDKKTSKSRGTAFIEFESYDKMKTCLKLYHHSLFDPDAHLHAGEDNETESTPQDDQKAAKRSKKNPSTTTSNDPTPPTKDTKPQWQKPKADKTRRINVELTAGGGGGKSADRRKKIQAKNAKLADERERFQRKEAEEREKKRVEGGGKGTGANADADGNGHAEADRGNVHPSRLRRVKG